MHVVQTKLGDSLELLGHSLCALTELVHWSSSRNVNVLRLCVMVFVVYTGHCYRYLNQNARYGFVNVSLIRWSLVVDVFGVVLSFFSAILFFQLLVPFSLPSCNEITDLILDAGSG